MRTTVLTFALASILGTVGCERGETEIPDETAEKDWEPPEEEPEAAAGEVDEEKAPILSRRRD